MEQNSSRKSWVFVLLTAGILSLVIVVIAIKSSGKHKAKIDYLAEYNRISKPAGFDPNDNAAPYFDKAFELMSDEPNDLENFRNLWPGDMNDDQLQMAKQCIESNKQALDFLKQALSKKYYWKPLYTENNEILKADLINLRGVRKAVYLSNLEAKLMARQSQIEPALIQLTDIYKMGTFIAGPKLLIEQLVGIAIGALSVQSAFQIIDRTNPSTAILEDFQKRITTLSSSRPFIISYESERLIIDDEVQRNYTGLVNRKLFAEPNVFFWRTFQIIRGYPWADMEKRKGAMVYDYLSASALKTPWQLHSEGNDIGGVVEEMSKGTYLLSMLVPNYSVLSRISYRTQVHTDGLITAIAILRFKADKGLYPQDLQELVSAGYLDKLPIDPFSGSPLVYKISGESFMLYSFAYDLDDDGGKHDPKWADNGDGDYVFWPVQYPEKGKEK